jgi:hypothetical protein
MGADVAVVNAASVEGASVEGASVEGASVEGASVEGEAGAVFELAAAPHVNWSWPRLAL